MEKLNEKVFLKTIIIITEIIAVRKTALGMGAAEKN